MTTDLLLRLRYSPWALALVVGLLPACQAEPNGRSPDSDASTRDVSDADDGSSGSTGWAVVSEFRTVCKPSEPCVRAIEVNSVGEIAVTDPVGTLDLAPHLEPALVDCYRSSRSAES